jgi:hypothetical protein
MVDLHILMNMCCRISEISFLLLSASLQLYKFLLYSFFGRFMAVADLQIIVLMSADYSFLSFYAVFVAAPSLDL